MPEVDKEKLAVVAKKHGLALVVLFGSRARGDAREKSDVDIGFLTPRTIDYRERYEVTEAFIMIFKNRNMELVDLAHVPPEVNRQVVNEGVVLFEARSGVFDRFSVNAYRRYVETKPLREHRYQYVKSFLHAYA